MSKLHILLPTYKRLDTIKTFVGDLEKQTFKNYHLLLINDGHCQKTETIVREKIANITVLKGKGQWWWAGSLQQGINELKKQKVSPRDYILIINDDTSFDKDFLTNGIKILSKYPKALLSPYIYSKHTGKLNNCGIKIAWPDLHFSISTDPKEIGCVTTYGLFIRYADLLSSGGFYPKFLPHYLSDFEFTIRAKRKGVEIITDPKLNLYINELTSGQNGTKDKSFFDYLCKLFSKRSPHNPFRWFIFITLACPGKYKLAAYLTFLRQKIWKMILKPIPILIYKRIIKREPRS